MKQSIQEIGMNSTFDEPEAPGGKWAGRMKWKPQGEPELPPAADLSADDLLDSPGVTASPEAAGTAPINRPRSGARFSWTPGDSGEVPIQGKPHPNPRFNWKPEGGGPVEKTSMRYASSQDIDTLIQAIRDEEALPPHQQNAAKIARLKAEATELMSQEESLKVQHLADRLLEAPQRLARPAPEGKERKFGPAPLGSQQPPAYSRFPSKAKKTGPKGWPTPPSNDYP